MLISIILAWISVVLAVFTALKFVARVSKNKALNKFFHKIHIPFGVLLLIAGTAHGVLAGNPSFATLSTMELAPVLFTFNWGTACFVCACLLGVTYLLRKKLKRKWMFLHRILTVAFIACIVLHLVDIGISLPDRLWGKNGVFTQPGTSTTQSPTKGSSAASSAIESAAESAASESVSATSQANSGESVQDPTSESVTDTSSAVVEFSGAVLNDGTYSGSADGYNGTITVSVTVSGGQVTQIDVTDENDTPQFFAQAETLLDTIINNQSLQVDAVSGATYSSAGLINATAAALQSGAVASGSLQITDIDLSQVQKHGH